MLILRHKTQHCYCKDKNCLYNNNTKISFLEVNFKLFYVLAQRYLRYDGEKGY